MVTKHLFNVRRHFGVRGPVSALVLGVVDAEIRCTKAVTGSRTPRRTSKKWLAPTFLSGGQTTLLLG